MKKRKLGTIEVSPIGMGCMAFSHGYGEVPAEEYALEAIRRAYDYGCTFFDKEGLIRGWGLSQPPRPAARLPQVEGQAGHPTHGLCAARSRPDGRPLRRPASDRHRRQIQ